MLCIHKIETSVGFKGHKGPVGLCRSNIGKLDGPRNVGCQPRHHLYLKAVWTWLPPELVNVRANKPMKGGSGWSTEEYYRWCNCTFQNHIWIRGCHEGYDRAQRNRETTSRKREHLYFLDGGWDWTIVNNTRLFLVFLSFSSAWPNADLVVTFSCCGLWWPSLSDGSKLRERVDIVFDVWNVCPCANPTIVIAWNKEKIERWKKKKKRKNNDNLKQREDM